MSTKQYLLFPFFLAISFGQDLIQSFDWAKLAPKAADTVEVNLDGFMLSLAKKFLSDSNPEESQAKKLIGNLKSIKVRSLKFNKEGDYTSADVDKLRSAVSGADWSKVVEVKNNESKGGNTGIYIKNNGSKIEGIVVLAAEPKELTIVQVIGSIDPEQLRALGDAGIIPKVGTILPAKPKAKND